MLAHFDSEFGVKFGLAGISGRKNILVKMCIYLCAGLYSSAFQPSGAFETLGFCITARTVGTSSTAVPAKPISTSAASRTNLRRLTLYPPVSTLKNQ